MLKHLAQNEIPALLPTSHPHAAGGAFIENDNDTARSVAGMPSQTDYNNWNRELLGEA